MDTVTRTFPISLTSNYTPNSIIEMCHFRDMVFDADEKAAVYLEDVNLVLNLKNMKLGILPNYDGDETENEKVVKFNDAENRSERFGLQVLTRKNNTGDWDEEVEIICINRGRKDYIGLLQPYFTKYSVKIIETNDAYAIRLIDYGFGLLKSTDSLKITMAFKIEISKKNDLTVFEARMAALELAINGRLNQINANHFLGREISTGVIQQIPFSRFATQGQIDQAIVDLVGGAPGALNTLIELASALNNDANFSATVTNQLALKAPLANPTFSGFIGLGDNVAIKEKLITGTVGSSMAGYTIINHGITGIIIGVQATVQNGGAGIGAMTPGFTVPNSRLEYYAYTTNTQFIIYTHATNSADILNKPFEAVITYRQRPT